MANDDKICVWCSHNVADKDKVNDSFKYLCFDCIAKIIAGISRNYRRYNRTELIDVEIRLPKKTKEKIKC